MEIIDKQDGGGSGGSSDYSKSMSGIGGSGTSYSGGTGGGASQGNITAENGLANGAAGGKGMTEYGRGGSSGAGGGAGNPAGYGLAPFHSPYYFYDSNGTGGLLIIYGSNVVNNFKILSQGISGGKTRIGGGSSGGGSINIFYSKEYSNSSLIDTNGGDAVGSTWKRWSRRNWFDFSRKYLNRNI